MPSINIYIQYIIVFSFSLAIAYKLNYKSPKKNELLLIWQNKCFHIHHWITYLLAIACLYLFIFIDIKYIHIVAVFLLGLVSEDLFYRNILQIREPCSKSCTLSSSVNNRKF